MIKVKHFSVYQAYFSNNFILQTTDGKGLIYFYLNKRVVISEEHHFYSGLSLLAEIGGYLGLLLGISFRNFASWIAGVIQKKINESFQRNY